MFARCQIAEFARKFILSSVIIFIRPGSSVQILSALMICAAFQTLVSYLKPYSADEDDSTVTVSFVSLTYTLILGITLKIRVYESATASDAETAWFTWLLIVVNVMLLGVSTWQFYHSVKEQYAHAKAVAQAMGGPRSRPERDVDLLEVGRSSAARQVIARQKSHMERTARRSRAQLSELNRQQAKLQAVQEDRRQRRKSLSEQKGPQDAADS